MYPYRNPYELTLEIIAKILIYFVIVLLIVFLSMFPEHVWERVIGYINNSRHLKNIEKIDDFFYEICQKQLLVIKREIFPAIPEKEIERLDFVLKHLHMFNSDDCIYDGERVIEQIEENISNCENDYYSKRYGERYKLPFSIPQDLTLDSFLSELAKKILDELDADIDYGGQIILVRLQANYSIWQSKYNRKYMLDCPKAEQQFLMFFDEGTISTGTLFENCQIFLDPDNFFREIKFGGYYPEDTYPVLDIFADCC